jgi:hypothetical protein
LDEDEEVGEAEGDSTYQGYLPPATIEQYQGYLPPSSFPNKVAPAPTTSATHQTSSMEKAKARKKHRKKIRRTIFKDIVLLMRWAFS